MTQSSETNETVYSAYMKPVIDYVVGFAEILILAVIFRVAADNTESLLIDVLAVTMGIVAGAYIGLPLGLFWKQFNRLKVRRLWVALAITAPIALGSVWVVNNITAEISSAVKQMAHSQSVQ